MKSKQVALSLAILLALGTGTVLHVEAQGNPTEYSRHFGDENTVTSDHSLAVGFRNTVSGSYSTAVGQSSTASGETSTVAIGSFKVSIVPASSSRSWNRRFNSLTEIFAVRRVASLYG